MEKKQRSMAVAALSMSTVTAKVAAAGAGGIPCACVVRSKVFLAALRRRRNAPASVRRRQLLQMAPRTASSAHSLRATRIATSRASSGCNATALLLLLFLVAKEDEEVED